MISVTMTCEPQPGASHLTCMPSNNTRALVFRDTSCYPLSISRFLRTEVQMEAVTAKGTYTSPYQLGVETMDNGNKTHMQQEELYLCQTRTLYSILQLGNQGFFCCVIASLASSLDAPAVSGDMFVSIHQCPPSLLSQVALQVSP